MFGEAIQRISENLIPVKSGVNPSELQIAEIAQSTYLKLPKRETILKGDSLLELADERQSNLCKLSQFGHNAGNFLSCIEQVIEAIKAEDESSRVELMGIRLKAIKAQH